MDLCYIKLKVSGTTQVTCLTHILLTALQADLCFVCLFVFVCFIVLQKANVSRPNANKEKRIYGCTARSLIH